MKNLALKVKLPVQRFQYHPTLLRVLVEIVKLNLKDFLKFRGSAFELETQLIIIENLELCPKNELQVLKEKLHIEQKMINKLISTIKAK